VNETKVHKQLASLELVLDEATRQDILTEVVWTACELQHKKHYPTLKAFNYSLWEWLLAKSKREVYSTPEEILEHFSQYRSK